MRNCIYVFFLFFTLSASAQIKNSQFAAFSDLGVEKKYFIEKYGLPTTKEMYYEKDSLCEVLNFVELLDDRIVVSTRFLFKNNSLYEVRSSVVETGLSKEVLDDIMSQLAYLRGRVMFIK